jgi:predicted dehydrogenase
METVRVGLIGSGFVSAIHAEALRRVPGAAIVAVASPTPGHAERLVRRHCSTSMPSRSS